MTSIFLYGTLLDDGLRRIVLGRDVEVHGATLPAHAVHWAKDESYPVLVAANGNANGGIFRAGEEDIARMVHYEGPFGYRLHPVTVLVPDGVQQAQVFLPPTPAPRPGPGFDLNDWSDRWGEISRLAAEEVMRGMGTRSADDIARRFGIIRARAQARINGRSISRPRTLGAAPDARRIEQVSLDRPYEGFFTVEDHVIRHPRFDGSMSAPVTRAAFTVAEAVTVLPYDPGRDRVLLIEQVRLGAYVSGDPDPWLLEPIAGMVDAGEDYQTCARREALEEAHVDLTALHHISRYYPSPGGVAQVLISYLGIADLPDDHATSGGLADEHEDIRIHLVDFDRLMDMVASGEIAVAPLILTAQWLALNRDRLRATTG